MRGIEKYLVENIQKVDFGDIDGLYDANLEKYFLDDNYWQKIIEENTFYIIGRKGTGKSAIYKWIQTQSVIHGCLISNLSFKTFPFEKLLKLSDDNFSKPNQYQSIWNNIILSEFASLIVRDELATINDEFKEMKSYVDYVFGEDLVDLHKQITTIADKSSTGISIKYVTGQTEKSCNKTLNDELDNITKINRRLENLIINYLIKYSGSNRFIIQFDQLDDNYNQLQDFNNYHQAIISLFKVIYDINQTFRSKNIKDSKVIAYLRSDIFYSINAFDSESARWDRYKLNLNWSIVNKDDWQNPRLIQVINKRISSSIRSIDERNAFSTIFDSKVIRMEDNGRPINIFKYLIHRTFHRPRDLVQFCIKIQDEVKSTGNLYHRTVNNAEKEYSLWLLSEVENEIGVKVKRIDTLYEFLRLMGSQSFPLTAFKSQFKNFEDKIEMEAEELLKYLYSMAIIHNVNYTTNNTYDYKNRYKKGYTEYFSVIRNDRSTFNRDLKIQIHPGFWKGLHTSNYSNRR
ncbi:P-loop ATPase, Sll1717 family [Ruminiclostridium cellobioparum]|uniref:ATPase n=1 Tax=Ruminiclostridium cellobioparum subsp. termitidis CT1112 TaxID=1195236 RepID=S0FM60_RUMCE|nr:hypothetical protein [Ruminiclostridium cellobioparum]EMS71386.1 hypothetical protein CTER_2699 [Ruminiclostridium cellobioparum subsp. termitidis CT1112]